MTVYYYSGFQLTEHYPNFALTNIDDGSVTFDVTVSDILSPLFNVADKHAHADMSAVLGSDWKDFAFALENAINGKAVGAGSAISVTVTYTESTQTYDITPNQVWSLETTADARALLGIQSAVYSGVFTIDSDFAPEQVIVSTIPGRSQVTDDYEPEDVASLAIADAGGTNVQGIARTAALTYQDWRQEFESKAACFSRAAATDTPWTYQDMIQHCRTVWPLRIVDDSASDDFIGYLRQGGASWSRDVIERAAADYDKHWHVNLRMYLVGRP